MPVPVKFNSNNMRLWRKTIRLWKQHKYRKSISHNKYNLFSTYSDRAWLNLYAALDTNRKLYKLKHRKL